MTEQIDIQLTDTACERFRSVLAGEGKSAVRLSLREAGCSGLEYVFDYADAPEAGDVVVEFDGFNLYVDPSDYDKAMQGLVIDFQQDMLSSAFVFNNPNKTGECGCGKSFTV